ncbi:hypothetical protein AYO37_01035 [Opitutia bacterium SCGC AG-212-L18]|nr:hypothetical protein AYO37_01035 [Opitutae bacterium SCGC AG-212-L18]
MIKILSFKKQKNKIMKPWIINQVGISPMDLRNQQIQDDSVVNPKGENDKRAKSSNVIIDRALSWVRINSRSITESLESLSTYYLYDNIKSKKEISEEDRKVISNAIKGILGKKIKDINKDIKNDIKSIKDFLSILLLGEQAISKVLKMKIMEELLEEKSLYQESLSQVSESQKAVNQLSMEIISFMQAEIEKLEVEGAFMYDSLRVLMMSLLSLSIVPLHQSILSILRYASGVLTAFCSSIVDGMQTVSVEVVNETINNTINDTIAELNEEMCGLDEMEGSDMPVLIALRAHPKTLNA